MTILYLCNVGLRDLLLDGKPLTPCRLQGEEVLQRYDELRKQLSAPIIRPGLDFVIRRHQRVDRLVLFATDQEREKVQTRHWESDTVNAAKVLEKLLKFQLDKKKLGDVRVRTINDGNPAQYDEMYAFFARQMDAKELQLDKLEKCYVCPAGGIPAANFALVIHAVRTYGQHCDVIYVDEGSGRVQPMQVSDHLLRAAKKDVILAHLRSYSFAEAVPLLEEVEATRVATSLASYAKHRLYFDFDTADLILAEGARSLSREERALCDKLRAELQALSQGSVEALLGELYHNASIAYRCEQYVDFLGRAFRFQETVLQLAAKRIYDVVLDDDRPEQHKRLQKLLNGNPQLKAHMDGAMVGNNRLDYTRINIPVLRELVRYAVEPAGGALPDGSQLFDEAGRKAYGEICAIIEKMSRLEDLRNKSIIAHGFRGVSREKLLEEYNRDSPEQTDPVGDMATVVRLLGLDPSDNPYDRIAATIRKEIERL